MHLLRNTFIALCALYGIICHAHPNGPEELSTGGTEPVEICGVLRHETRWGPPNFGENPKTDSRFTVWIVSLRKSVSVRSGSEIGKEGREDVSEIQLSIDRSKFKRKDLQQLDSKQVQASGKLWTATSQGDVTPVVLALTKIKTASKSGVCSTKQGGNP